MKIYTRILKRLEKVIDRKLKKVSHERIEIIRDLLVKITDKLNTRLAKKYS